MKKLIFILVSIITIISVVSGKTRLKWSMCRLCKTIDVYVMKDDMQKCYLVIDYMDSMYYEHNASFPGRCAMGYFTVKNDILTLVETATVIRKKNNIQVLENDKTELEKHYTNHYRIEGGGDRLKFCGHIDIGNKSDYFSNRIFYKCKGTPEYEQARQVDDSLRRIYIAERDREVQRWRNSIRESSDFEKSVLQKISKKRLQK